MAVMWMLLHNFLRGSRDELYQKKHFYSLYNYTRAGVGAGLPFQMVIAPLAGIALWMQLFASACLPWAKIIQHSASSLTP